jgi:hypothetical protein
MGRRASRPWPWAESRLKHCFPFLILFLFKNSRNMYKTLKYIENKIKLIKI